MRCLPKRCLAFLVAVGLALSVQNGHAQTDYIQTGDTLMSGDAGNPGFDPALALERLDSLIGAGSVPVSDVAKTPQTEVRLIAARDGVPVDGDMRLGLLFDLEPDWKIYWRSPGDAGFPPSIDWSDSDNAVPGEMLWPAAHRFSVLGIETVGYEDRVLFPIPLSVPDPERPAMLRATVDYLICSDVCIPQKVDLALDLPPGGGPVADAAHLIETFAERVPGAGALHGLDLAGAVLSTDSPPVLRVTVESSLPFGDPDVFVEGAEDVWFRTPEVRMTEGATRATLDLTASSLLYEGAALGDYLRDRPLVLTVVDGNRGLETEVTPRIAETTEVFAAGFETESARAGGMALVIVTMLGLAVLGGLILNLMPCVLPVLSLKLIGLIGHGGSAPRIIRFNFLATALGIVVSFWLLAALALALKSAGAAAGWGIQFQNPLFVGFMIVLLSLFAANMWGLFEIRLPSAVNDRLGGGGAGGGLAGHFGSGMFATLLATPCSAPFLGTAIAFALSRGAGEIVMIFSALGLGMALPYLTIAAFPGIARAMPKPGAWMVKLKWAMGVALIGTAVWLLAVMNTLLGTGPTAVMAALMMALLVVFAVRARGDAGASLRQSAGVAAIVLALAGLTVPAVVEPADAAPVRAASSAWGAFEPARIATHVAAGRVVVIDVTADWCVTCQVNKAAVLERGRVAEALFTGDIITMQGDWTRPNDEIAAYLAGHDRFGIPFNAVYGPGAPDGVLLPELLTPDAVLSAIEIARAAGDQVASGS